MKFNPQKVRLTNDARYQEFTEMTLDWLFDGTSVRGHFSFPGIRNLTKQKGAVKPPQHIYRIISQNNSQ